MNSRLLLVMAAVAVGMAGVASAGTYRWVDQDGKPHYSDTPIQGSAPVTVRAPGVDAGKEAAPAQDPAAEAAAKDAATVKAEQCAQASKRLKDYKGSGTLYEQDEYGRKRDITGDERVNLIVKTQRDVKEFCGDQQATAVTQ